MVKRKRVVIENLDPTAMYCPSCLTKLVATDRFRYEDVCNDTIWSHKWVCPSKGFLNRKTGQFQQCLCHEYETFWNDDGDFFTGRVYYQQKLDGKNIEFIQGPGTYAAFNSFAKKAEVSIYGKNLKRKTYLHPVFCLWFLRPYIEYSYQSDALGNVLGRSWKLAFLAKSQGSRSYCVLWVSPYRMFKYCLKTFYRKRKIYKKQLPDTQYLIQQLHEEFEPLPAWDKRLYHVLYKWYINTFYRGLKKEISKKIEKPLFN